MGLESLFGSKKQEAVVVRQDKVEVSPEIKDLVQPTETDFQTTPQDAQAFSGGPLVQTPAQPVTIDIASSNKEQLKKLAHGRTEDTITWYAAAILRELALKAFRSVKNMFAGQPKVNQPV